MVLGATLALGGCSLAGCGEESPPEPKLPPLADVRAAVVEEPVEQERAVQLDRPDVEAELARFGTIEAAPGFVPDPLIQSGQAAGGPVDARQYDERCTGWIAAQPDVILHTPRPFAELSVMVASAEDTSLMIVGPDGDARCGDDEDGSMPIVRGPFAAGEHRVWVGIARAGAEAPFSLALSELEESSPSALLQ